MPMTPWDEIVGYTCWDCGKWATHWYGGIPICCRCHMGVKESDWDMGDEGEWMAKEAIKANSLFQKGLALTWDDDEYDTIT